MLPENLVPFATTPIPVLDDGHVLLVDVMGDEQAILDAARVSYGAGTKRVLEDRGLLRYLLRHHHMTPFEMCEIKVRVRVPMDIWRQWVRHRTASINEYSTRYSEAIDATVKTDPDCWRMQAEDNKQGSAGFIQFWPEGMVRPDDNEGNDPNGGWIGEDYYTSPGAYLSEKEAELHRVAREVYMERVTKFGMAREQARKDLPLSTYTEAYWKIDLRNLLGFLFLRLDTHAHWEIRAYSEALASILKVWMPTVWEAFEDYILHAESFSRMELEGLRALLDGCLDADATKNTSYRKQSIHRATELAVAASGLKAREAKEFRAKLAKLFR